MQHYWFGDVDESGCRPSPSGKQAMAERIRSLQIGMDAFQPLSWEQAKECGIADDREEYLQRLRNLCFLLAEEKIASHYREGDQELLQMVRMLDELDTCINLLSERATEWYQVRNPGFTRKYRTLTAKKMVGVMKKERGSYLARIAAEIDGLSTARSALMKDVSDGADRIAPNCSALVGGLVAARLIARAGGLEQLARLPASTIQVLGAENALFTHLRSGTPSPKHGIIFQHRRVHNAQGGVRGRVARVLAGKLSIAARLDYFRGEADPVFLDKAQRRIDEVGGVHDPD
jgi:nucleolar protein 56